MKRKIFFAFATAMSLTACTPKSHVPYAEIFQDNGVEGAFVMSNLSGSKNYIYNEKRARQPFIPASTFKILNALIALETGAIADTGTVIKWDGIERSIPQWNRDHNLRSAIQVSAVWFYQILARRIGAEKMADFVARSNYGNKNITGQIDSFWLDGALRISSLQQIEFLKSFYREELPFSTNNFAKVKTMLVAERGTDYVLRAKTGWGGAGDQEVGWYIGYLEKKQDTYFFVTNIAIKNNKDAQARKRITHRILKDLNLLPQ